MTDPTVLKGKIANSVEDVICCDTPLNPTSSYSNTKLPETNRERNDIRFNIHPLPNQTDKQ